MDDFILHHIITLKYIIPTFILKFLANQCPARISISTYSNIRDLNRVYKRCYVDITQIIFHECYSSGDKTTDNYIVIAGTIQVGKGVNPFMQAEENYIYIYIYIYL